RHHPRPARQEEDRLLLLPHPGRRAGDRRSGRHHREGEDPRRRPHRRAHRSDGPLGRGQVAGGGRSHLRGREAGGKGGAARRWRGGARARRREQRRPAAGRRPRARREGGVGDAAPRDARGPVPPAGARQRRGSASVMMGRIYAVALNTFRWAIRHRFLVAVILVATGVMLFALVLGEMSLHQEERVAVDVGLGGVSFFGWITAIVLGVLLLSTEIQRRTIHTMLSKPIERHELLLGRYAGMAASLTLLVVVSTIIMAGMFWLRDAPFTGSTVKSLLLLWLEVLVVAAIAAFFSSFASPILSGVFTFGIFAVGRVTPELRAAIDSASSPLIRGVCKVALYAVP